MLLHVSPKKLKNLGNGHQRITGIREGLGRVTTKSSGWVLQQFRATVPSRLSSSPTVQPPCSAACGSANTKLSDIMRGNPKFHWATFTGSARLIAACDIQAAVFDSAARIAGVPACAMSANEVGKTSAAQVCAQRPWTARVAKSGCLEHGVHDMQWRQVA